MKIASSQVQFYSNHTYTEQHERRESLRVWQDGQEPVTLTSQGADGQLRGLADSFTQSAQVTLSPKAKAMAPVKTTAEATDTELSDEDALKIAILKMLIERLTGEEMKIVDARELREKIEHTDPALDEVVQLDPSQADSTRQGFGLVYDYYEAHRESEHTQFSAQGVIRTADGQQIEFTVDLNMAREFVSEDRINLRAGDALKDPLVVNFSGRAAELSQTQFSFDIDADGRKEQISFVGPNSGFLALDRNGDGMINDGSELFGTRSGDGFGDLAGYDADANQWIDENDPIFDQLRIWQKDSKGNDQLLALGKKGIGAIYLGNIATSFMLKDQDNTLLGAVRASSIYINENGSTGTLQQVDLRV